MLIHVMNLVVMIVRAGGQLRRLTCVPAGCYQLLSYTISSVISVMIYICKSEINDSRHVQRAYINIFSHVHKTNFP